MAKTQKPATHICMTCGTETRKPKWCRRGSGIAEIFLWLLFIVPGFLYTLWRAERHIPYCRACGVGLMLSLATPAGQKLHAEYEDHGPKELVPYQWN